MSESKLDQIVKGAPPPAAKLPSGDRTQSATLAAAESAIQDSDNNPLEPTDPLSTLPSSPQQIYLNLLILEASLRAQYLTLRARRRQHTFFLLLLTAWIACFSYLLFLWPREDGRGLGGSPYWVIEMAEKVALMCGVITGILLWGTGQWERGMRWPRRWVGVANRGLRGVNSKLVVIKGPWWKEIFSTLSFLFPYSSLFFSSGSSYHYVDSLPAAANEKRPPPRTPNRSPNPRVEEDLSPGGDYVKLLLLPKPFSPEFREHWETYRAEYWERENERRALLRTQLHAQQRESAKQQGKWLWWTGWRGKGAGDWWRQRRGGTTNSARAPGSKPEVERPHTHAHNHQQHPKASHHTSAGAGEKDSSTASTASKASRRPRKERAGSVSTSAGRSSSRSSTASSALDVGGADDRPDAGSSAAARARRGSGSVASTTSERRKKGKTGAGTSPSPPSTRGATAAAAASAVKSPPFPTAPGSRPSTPETRSSLTRGWSSHSTSGASD
ncbi:MAG: hypothetical protein M4579_003523 [Chaenotheca gracillima]|nr:MAG: hypothetical protein M4579_003523 [Chaenotheca gracillima]